MTDWQYDRPSIRDRRVQYETAGLDVADVAPTRSSSGSAGTTSALDAGVAEPNAMVLSTVDLRRQPDARVVLVRGVDRNGFMFFTNYESAKSRQLTARPVAGATFSGSTCTARSGCAARRAGRAMTRATPTSHRDRAPSQIGGVGVAAVRGDRRPRRARWSWSTADERRFAGAPVPRPPHWGGWRLVPRRMGVLAGPPEPAARPFPLSAHRCRVGHPATRAVISAWERFRNWRFAGLKAGRRRGNLAR